MTYADGPTTTYAWDVGNRLTQVSDSVAGTIARSYDLLDRLIEEGIPQGTVSYGYDAAGRRTSMTVSGQAPVTYGYDDANRRTEIVQGSAVMRFTHDAVGRPTALSLPNRIVTAYTYDAASRGRRAERVARAMAIVGTLAQLAGCASPGPPQPDPRETIRTRIAQVVDADTGQPIDGALVLTVFYLWPKRGFGNFPVSKVFRDSAETVTDREGRFVLTGPFVPDSFWTEALHIYKPGYGPWRFQGQDQDKLPRSKEEALAYWARIQQMWDRLTTTGVVIELRPLRTREERLKHIDRGWAVGDDLGAGFHREMSPFSPHFFFDVPADRLIRFQELVDEERASLGLPVRRLDGHRQPR